MVVLWGFSDVIVGFWGILGTFLRFGMLFGFGIFVFGWFYVCVRLGYLRFVGLVFTLVFVAVSFLCWFGLVWVVFWIADFGVTDWVCSMLVWNAMCFDLVVLADFRLCYFSFASVFLLLLGCGGLGLIVCGCLGCFVLV